MDQLGDPLTTQPIQMGCEISIEPYPSWRFRCIGSQDRKFGDSSVWTRTRTRSDSPEPLLPLTMILTGSIAMVAAWSYDCPGIW